MSKLYVVTEEQARAIKALARASNTLWAKRCNCQLTNEDWAAFGQALADCHGADPTHPARFDVFRLEK